VFTLEVNVLIELLNAIKLAVNELIEPVDATLAVNKFKEAVVVLTELLNVLNEDVVTNEAELTFPADAV
jgi:hypothetical protein